MKIAWATDIHLDFLQRDGGTNLVRQVFVEPLVASNPDAVIISGDISLSDMLEDHLRLIDAAVRCPVYFVLGNHDFYGGSFESVRSAVMRASLGSRNLRYLTVEKEPISLAPGLTLVGHDGWYDAHYGRPFSAGLVMSDWLQIDDFASRLHSFPGGASIDPHSIAGVAREAAFKAAEHVLETSRLAAQSSKNVIVVTHVPPFPEIHEQGGKGNHEAAIPWYTSRFMGEAIDQVSMENPGVNFTVFCGHTHHKARLRRNNVDCYVGGSEYGEPTYSMIEVK